MRTISGLAIVGLACVFAAVLGAGPALADPAQGCTRKVMNIVAHEDDDTIFFGTEEMKDIRSGACVRTLYLTAGESRIAKPHRRARCEQIDEESAKPTLKARRSIIWERGCSRDPTAIDRNPEALCEVTKHWRPATRSDHPARRRCATSRSLPRMHGGIYSSAGRVALKTAS